MGRPRKPNNLKILDGDQPCRINGNEPATPKGIGQPPDWLDEIGRGAWIEVSARLDEMKVGGLADARVVALYCEEYANWQDLRARIRELGPIVECRTETPGKRGPTIRVVLKANPLLPSLLKLQHQMAALLGQLGMTPSARAGLHVETGAKGNAVLAFFAGSNPGVKKGG